MSSNIFLYSGCIDHSLKHLSPKQKSYVFLCPSVTSSVAVEVSLFDYENNVFVTDLLSFFMAIVLSVLRFTASDCPLCIFKLFVLNWSPGGQPLITQVIFSVSPLYL